MFLRYVQIYIYINLHRLAPEQDYLVSSFLSIQKVPTLHSSRNLTELNIVTLCHLILDTRGAKS